MNKKIKGYEVMKLIAEKQIKNKQEFLFTNADGVEEKIFWDGENFKYSETERDYVLSTVGDVEFAVGNFEILEEYVSPDNDFDLKKYTQESFGVFHDELVKVKLKFNKEIAEDVLNYNFHPTQKITQQKNGSVIVEFTSSGIKSILFNLFKWGSNVEIVSPKKLKDRYRNYLNEVLNNLK